MRLTIGFVPLGDYSQTVREALAALANLRYRERKISVRKDAYERTFFSAGNG